MKRVPKMSSTCVNVVPCFVLQVFFVIRLHNQQIAASLPPIEEPDPAMSCELMDGRDAFLTTAREKHYEFSSLRRAKLSSMALLYELHNQGKEAFVYTCNNCKAAVETRFLCSQCDVSTYSSHVKIFDIYFFLPFLLS